MIPGAFVEAKITRAKDGLLLSGELPPGLADSGAVEIFPLRDGACLLLAKGMLPPLQSGGEGAPRLDASEALLLRKLLSVRFESRIPAQVDRTLSHEEKTILSSLLKKGLVSVFHGRKYGASGVYNVSDKAFSLVREPVAAHAASSPAELLEQQGYLVVEGEGEAKALGNALSEKIKSGEVAGLRAFDRKCYFLKKSYLDQAGAKLLSCLWKSPKGEQEVAKEAGLPLEGCRAVLLHLCESGEALEKAPGKFARA